MVNLPVNSLFNLISFLFSLSLLLPSLLVSFTSYFAALSPIFFSISSSILSACASRHTYYTVHACIGRGNVGVTI